MKFIFVLLFILIVVIILSLFIFVVSLNIKKKKKKISLSIESCIKEPKYIQSMSNISGDIETVKISDSHEFLEIKKMPSSENLQNTQPINEILVSNDDKANNIIENISNAKTEFETFFIGNDLKKGKKNVLEPIKRGGRPRNPDQEQKSANISLSQNFNFLSKPEIVYLAKGPEWMVGIEIPDEILAYQDISVLQNGKYLDRDSNIDNFWKLEAVSGEIKIEFIDKEKNKKEIIFTIEKPYMVFKLIGENQKRGYLVSNPSKGLYLIIVPEIWEYLNVSTVNRIAQLEPSSLKGYLAHFCEFSLDKEDFVSFKTDEDKIVTIKPSKPKFEFVGNLLEDSSLNIGPLFGDSIPQIKAFSNNAWNDISVIVVGEEGRTKNRWRNQIIPDRFQNPQIIANAFPENCSGWYYVRIYNNENSLAESMDFRYIRSLKKIHIPKHQHLFLGENGYQTAQVELLHSPDFIIKNSNNRNEFEINHKSPENTIISIPANPDFDKSDWLIEIDHNKNIPLTILLKRVWWGIGSENQIPSEWLDKLIFLQRSDFSALSDKALWIRCPRDFKSKSISIRIGENLRERRYKISDSRAMIPIREFSDATELMLNNNLSIFASFPQDNIEIKICEVLRRFQCKFCDFTASNEQDIIAHAIANHLHQMFITASYDELKAIDPKLPHRIYQCTYCGFYAKSDDIENPTSKIIHHINNDCKKAPRNDGPPRTDFKIISNVDEIRNNIIAELPYIEKCYFCGKTFERATDNEKIAHLKERHMSLLYKLL